MPVYKYKTLDPDGGRDQGVIDADTGRQARDQLRARGLHVLEMSELERDESPTADPRVRVPRLRRGRDLVMLALLTRQMATLLGAGVTVTDALGALIEQLEDSRMQGVFRSVREAITHGASLAEGLANHPAVFGDMYVNMVAAGEASGSLEVVLRRLADYTQGQARLQGRIGAALAYPIVMASIGLAVVVFLLGFVVPKITQVLIGQGKLLPLPTRILIGVSDFVVGYWPLLVALAAGLVVAWVSLRRSELADRIRLRLPVVGGLYRGHAISRFAKTLATLLAGGMQVTDALRITSRVIGNKVFERALNEAHDQILSGADIATPIRESGLFPASVGYMIAIGERTGQMEDLLERIAESYDEEIELTTQKVMSLLEPVMIVSLSLVVGFIVLAIVLPILEASKL